MIQKKSGAPHMFSEPWLVEIPPHPWRFQGHSFACKAVSHVLLFLRSFTTNSDLLHSSVYCITDATDNFWICPLCNSFLKKYFFIICFWLCWVSVTACNSELQYMVFFSSWGARDSVVVAHGLSCPTACGILVSQPGIEPTFPALAGGFLTPGPQWSPSVQFLYQVLCK